VTQEQFGTGGDRVNVIQRSMRCVKSELKKMKEAQEKPEHWHKLENSRQVLRAIEDVRVLTQGTRSITVRGRGRESHGENKKLGTT
jgi:hypothetical protein